MKHYSQKLTITRTVLISFLETFPSSFRHRSTQNAMTVQNCLWSFYSKPNITVDERQTRLWTEADEKFQK